MGMGWGWDGSGKDLWERAGGFEALEMRAISLLGAFGA